MFSNKSAVKFNLSLRSDLNSVNIFVRKFDLTLSDPTSLRP